MATIASLPVELFRDLVDHIEKDSDVVPLLWVCSAFRVEAQRRLYRRISRNSEDTCAQRIVSHWLECTTEIGKYIYRLDLDDITDGDGDQEDNRRLNQAYQSMINLKELSLPPISNGSLIPPATPPFQLVCFSSQVASGSHKDTFKTHILPFLSSQPSIRELDLFADHDEPISPNLLPNLTNIMTKPSLAFRLLPGRSVRCLFLYISTLAGPTKEIENVTTLRSLSLDHFESLELYKSCFLTLEFLELYTPSVDALEAYVSKIPRLRTLRLAARIYKAESAKKDVERLFKVSPMLEGIFIAQRTHWPNHGDHVDVWKREGTERREEHWEEHAWKI